ncbi:LLM class flavin-dependent oxidoreductase [Miltoncostaea marina]|uniref:LLM class flavin-dependent oxidoreductase n=1 Tax=Miltoncostaea marina TaxID=2843215 RepID=UPI001C3C4D10|nr:LLM class flavin-dependent oxidoreductase [Miltoncostaea marina]
MDLGIFLPTMAPRGAAVGDVVAAARHAERLGFESVWAVDQLVAGTGVPIMDSTVALAAAAAATTTVGIGYGVLVLPLRPAAWAAKQAASLQLVSGGRLLLGVGVGGERHARSWDAAGVPRRERGRRTDAALGALPAWIAGDEALVGGRPVRLAPGVPRPPVLVGGAGEAALARAVAHGDGWFGLPLPPARLAATVGRLRELADTAGRTPPSVTGSAMVAMEGDPAVPGDAALARILTDPDGLFGMPAEALPGMVLRTPRALAERLATWAGLGARRVVLTVAGGDWARQAELVAVAAAAAGAPEARAGAERG